MRTGFLGRCCDLMGNASGVSAVSVGGGATPALLSGFGGVTGNASGYLDGSLGGSLSLVRELIRWIRGSASFTSRGVLMR